MARSINEAVTSLSAKASVLHILIANAGVFCPPHAKTEQGFEVSLQHCRWPLLPLTAFAFALSHTPPLDDSCAQVTVGTAYFGHVLLIELLLPALKRGAPSRVVFVSGSLESSARLDWADLG